MFQVDSFLHNMCRLRDNQCKWWMNDALNESSLKRIRWIMRSITRIKNSNEAKSQELFSKWSNKIVRSIQIDNTHPVTRHKMQTTIQIYDKHKYHFYNFVKWTLSCMHETVMPKQKLRADCFFFIVYIRQTWSVPWRRLNCGVCKSATFVKFSLCLNWWLLRSAFAATVTCFCKQIAVTFILFCGRNYLRVA